MAKSSGSTVSAVLLADNGGTTIFVKVFSTFGAVRGIAVSALLAATNCLLFICGTVLVRMTGDGVS